MHSSHTAALVTTATLLATLRAHGVPCRMQADGQLRVAHQYAGKPGYSREIEVIEPTARAVYVWLGY